MLMEAYRMDDIPYTEYRLMVARLEALRDILQRTIAVAGLNRLRAAQGLPALTIDDDLSVIEGQCMPVKMITST
jgi:hypothetical protein